MAFIEQRRDLESELRPCEILEIPIYGGSKAMRSRRLATRLNRTFREIVKRVELVELEYDDQCSVWYYLDLVRTIQRFRRQFDRVVEVGVFMGGASTVLAGLQEKQGFQLDLVDVNEAYLQFTAERIRRTFPSAKFRLWLGDLPSYTKHILMQEDCRIVLQHDGAHDFNTVVADLTALSFVSEKVHAIIAQDTNLRGTLEHMNFVDMALLAVFGKKMKSRSIGLRPPLRFSSELTRPNQWQGNYALADEAEGRVVKISSNRFRYPHPSMDFDAMFPNH